MAFGVLLDFWGGSSHGEGEGSVLQHGEIVNVVADGDDLVGMDVEDAGEVLEAGPLVGVLGWKTSMIWQS